MAYQAITVKYLGATDYKPSRLKAISASGISITRAYDGDYSIDNDMANIAHELATKLEWFGEWRGGTLEDGKMVWVLDTENYFVVCKPLQGVNS